MLGIGRDPEAIRPHRRSEGISRAERLLPMARLKKFVERCNMPSNLSAHHSTIYTIARSPKPLKSLKLLKPMKSLKSRATDAGWTLPRNLELLHRGCACYLAAAPYVDTAPIRNSVSSCLYVTKRMVDVTEQCDTTISMALEYPLWHARRLQPGHQKFGETDGSVQAPTEAFTAPAPESIRTCVVV